MHVELEPAASVEEPEAAAEPTTCAELEDALTSDTPLADAWNGLPEGHRAEYGRWISTAEATEDRAARVQRLRHRLLD